MEDSGDQKRVADINFSKENLVDFIVVGRPIYKNENPNDIVKKILKIYKKKKQMVKGFLRDFLL